VGKKHYSGLVDWIRETLLCGKYISPEDLDFLTVLDDPTRWYTLSKNM